MPNRVTGDTVFSNKIKISERRCVTQCSHKANTISSSHWKQKNFNGLGSSVWQPSTNPISNDDQVLHRKSERRRVARDIFLVFEEEPCTGRLRRSHHKRKKSKFSHLNVENPYRSKNLLRDFKNKTNVNLSLQKSVHKCRNSTNSILGPIAFAKENIFNTKEINLKTITMPSDVTSSEITVAKVNPIFVWVKQEGTRIIEVRCEDYDKRNRIRITKTSTGWRAVPRSDPTSSVIAKVNSTTMTAVKMDHRDHSFIEPNLKNIDEQQLIKKNLCHPLNVSLKDTAVHKYEKVVDMNDMHVNVALVNSEDKKRSKLHNRIEIEAMRSKAKISSDDADNGFENNTDKTQLKLFTAEKNTEKTNFVENNRSSLKTAISNIGYKQLIKASKTKRKNTLRDRQRYKAAKVIDDIKQTSSNNNLQLCPKTGLFIPCDQVADDEVKMNVSNDFLKKKYDTNKFEMVSKAQSNSNESNLENTKIDNTCNAKSDEKFESDTENIKNLIHNGDFLQLCENNRNGHTELIDSSVLINSEKNLMEHTTKEKIPTENKLISTKYFDGITSNLYESPKCLSFNETGEIESISSDVFPANEVLFDKNSKQTVNTQHSSKPPSCGKTKSDISKALISDLDVSNSPCDLNYKKSNQIFPVTESYSQCDIISNSDIIKSRESNDQPSCSLVSSVESLKNLILEQIIKLNLLHPPGKHKNSLSSMNKKDNIASNFSETAVFNDGHNIGPLRKRSRNSSVYDSDNQMTFDIDKDPDPLTQLQLLLRSTQWKVPDPILVPKERLRAVLNSPAREIPLLITTRPELRLPDAFAYPDIIQNPSILVISMAQLEAILKNEESVKKSTISSKLGQSIICMTPTQILNDGPDNCVLNNNTLKVNRTEDINHNLLANSKTQELMTDKQNCTYNDMEINLMKDFNVSNAYAVLNQMLWLPHFGKLPHDFIKPMKDPLFEKREKLHNLLPIYANSSKDFQHIDADYRNQKTLPQLPNKNYSIHGGKHDVYGAHNVTTLNPNMTPTSTSTLSSTLLSIRKSPSSIERCSQNLATQSMKSINHNEQNDLSIRMLDQSYNVKSAILNHSKKHSDITENISDITHLNGVCDKPRLTCKSLSNLLEPRYNLQNGYLTGNSNARMIFHPNPNSIYCDANRVMCDESEYDLDAICSGIKQFNDMSPGVTRDCEKYPIKRNGIGVAINTMNHVPHNSHNNDLPSWHPLIVSNSSKSVYSRHPWQWTTVTANGE